TCWTLKPLSLAGEQRQRFCHFSPPCAPDFRAIASIPAPARSPCFPHITERTQESQEARPFVVKFLRKFRTSIRKLNAQIVQRRTPYRHLHQERLTIQLERSMKAKERGGGRATKYFSILIFFTTVILAPFVLFAQNSPGSTGGPPPFFDYSMQHPGAVHKITAADLPQPDPTGAVSRHATMVDRPKDAWPQAPNGFKVDLYANGIKNPRLIRTAPNGDLFLADSRAGQILVYRGVGKDGKAVQTATYAADLDHPFGIAFYPLGPDPKWVYVANTTSVVRFHYQNGDLKARGVPETIVAKLPGYAQLAGGGHWTRDLAFSLDGKKLFVSVGSGSNVDDPDTHTREFHRADVLEFTPEGKFAKVYASGI